MVHHWQRASLSRDFVLFCNKQVRIVPYIPDTATKNYRACQSFVCRRPLGHVWPLLLLTSCSQQIPQLVHNWLLIVQWDQSPDANIVWVNITVHLTARMHHCKIPEFQPHPPLARKLVLSATNCLIYAKATNVNTDLANLSTFAPPVRSHTLQLSVGTIDHLHQNRPVGISLINCEHSFSFHNLCNISKTTVYVWSLQIAHVHVYTCVYALE